MKGSGKPEKVDDLIATQNTSTVDLLYVKARGEYFFKNDEWKVSKGLPLNECKICRCILL